MNPQRFFGKFRGQCVDNVDPMQVGRIAAIVPDVLGGTPSGWALPCLPVAGTSSGMVALPPIGSWVWIEFEQGDPDRPIWTGGMWSVRTLPPASMGVPAGGFTLQTPGGAALTVGDAPGFAGLVLRSAGGASITVTDAGITIDNGRGAVISLVGPTVDIINGAQVVV
jgi:uncharacterized protein involved in type VI secretion and phage assembly